MSGFTKSIHEPDYRDYTERLLLARGSLPRASVRSSYSPAKSRRSEYFVVDRNFDQASNYTEHSAFLLTRKEGRTKLHNRSLFTLCYLLTI